MRMTHGGKIFLLLSVMFASSVLFSQPAHPDESQAIKTVIHQLLSENSDFVKKHDAKFFAPFVERQHPDVTVLMCSDSRVQVHSFDTLPDNDLFVIRNIGNQLVTSEGSVEYGVHHLHTPILLIVGHVRCGAIQAALGNYSKESPAIQKELTTIHIKKGGEWLASVKINVNNQVKASEEKFKAEVDEGILAVVGAVYDFADDLHGGFGKLSIINVNGETDPQKIKTLIGD